VICPQNHSNDFNRFGLKTCCDGFCWFDLKTSGGGFLQFSIKTSGDGFFQLSLKTKVVEGFPVWASKPVALV
jgi:hypothetical protein